LTEHTIDQCGEFFGLLLLSFALSLLSQLFLAHHVFIVSIRIDLVVARLRVRLGHFAHAMFLLLLLVAVLRIRSLALVIVFVVFVDIGQIRQVDIFVRVVAAGTLVGLVPLVLILGILLVLAHLIFKAKRI
jgi:hypothetical protein